MTDHHSFDAQQVQQLVNSLTPRETQILSLFSAGLSSSDVAAQLFLSQETVKWYAKQIYSKLDVHTRYEAVALLDKLKTAAPAQEASAILTNLPASTTRLVGRKDEIATLHRYLLRQEVRLLSLVGTPGIGKTRLSIEAARTLPDVFTDGVFFVGLASLTEPLFVSDAIRSALNLRDMGGQTTLTFLKHHLREKRLLLILDNFEHVLSAAPLVTELLNQAPYLKVLVTSREMLHVYGEHVYNVPPLRVPSVQHSGAIDTLAQVETVSLFVQRAQAVKQDFTLTQDNAAAIATLCTRLDGLPLAIELAAARVKWLSPQLMATRLDKRFGMLVGGARDAHPRQQTLEALIGWSYDLLNQAEQDLFAYLGVFVGGWTLESLDAVCGDDQQHHLESLLNKSLVQDLPSTGDEPRFMMLETLRAFAVEKLETHPQASAIRQNYARYFLYLAGQAAPELRGNDQLGWLSRLEEENDNLRSAIEWMVANEQFEMLHTVSGYLAIFWHDNGYLEEGRRWLEAALRANMTISPALQLQTLEALFSLTWAQGDYPALQAYTEHLLNLTETTTSKEIIASAFKLLGSIALALGDYTDARTYYEASQRSERVLKNPWSISFALAGLGEIAYLQGDYELARTLYEDDLRAARAGGASRAIAAALNGLAKVADMQGHYDSAASYATESLHLAVKLNDQQGIAINYNRLGRVARQHGNYEEARQHHQQSLAIAQMLNYQPILAFTLNKLGELAYDEGDYPSAIQLHERAFAITQHMNDPYRLADNRCYLAFAYIKVEQFEGARQHLREALQVASSIQAVVMLLQALAGIAEWNIACGDAKRGAQLLAFVLQHPAAPASLRRMLMPTWNAFSPTLHTTLSIPASVPVNEGVLTLESAIDYALEVTALSS